MKTLRNLIAVMAMMSMAAVFTGCGDDDDDNDNGGNNNTNQPPNIVAPTTEAELTAATKTYTVNVAGQTNQFTLIFPASGQYQISENGAPTEIGTFTAATRSDNSWTMNIVPNPGQHGAEPGVLRLDFTSSAQGTWTFTPTDGQAEIGQFTLTDTDPDPDPDPDPNPELLTGKTLQLTAPSGAGEKFEFISGTVVSYEDNSLTGTYTWDPTSRRIDVTLENGWLFEITIPSGSNIANVVFRDSAGAEPETSNPEYVITGGE